MQISKNIGKKFKCLGSIDNGNKYIAKYLQDFCDLKGIKRELMYMYIPSQNGVVECMNHTIQERICSMLSNVDNPSQNGVAKCINHTILSFFFAYV